LLSCFKQITWWLARLPGGNWWLPSPHGGWILVCLLGVLLCFIKPAKERIWLLGMVAFLALGIGWEYWEQRTVGECSLTVFNLPQGECMLLQQGKYKWLLDTGTQKGFENTVLPCMKQAGIQALTGIALSHEDDDHRGGSRLCASALKVKQVVAPNTQSVALCRDLVADITILARGMRWQPGQDWHAQAFWPPAGAKLSSNAGSLGLAISLPGNWVLVTVGDAPEECERRFALDLSGPVVYKASHHGAKHANSQTWLGRLQPSLILLSPGYANRFGFPNAATLERFRALGCPVLDAATLGGYRLEFSQKPGTWRVAKVNLGPRKRLP
jgi:competence protein ComEC